MRTPEDTDDTLSLPQISWKPSKFMVSRLKRSKVEINRKELNRKNNRINADRDFRNIQSYSFFDI